MFNLAEFINSTFGSNGCFLFIELLSVFCKLFLFITLIIYNFYRPVEKKFFWLLFPLLFAAIFPDIAWILVLVRRVFNPDLDLRLIALFSRLGWICFLAQNQLFVIFLANFLTKEFHLKKRDILFSVVTVSLAGCWLYFASFCFNVYMQSSTMLFYELTLYQISGLLVVFLFVPVSFELVNKDTTKFLPNILKHQLKALAILFIVPYFLLELITNNLLMAPFITQYTGIDTNAMLSISTLLITYALFYCCRRIIGMRFLNFNSHVQSNIKFNFIDDFKMILEQLGQVTTIKELAFVTQNFFKAAFSIPLGRARLYMRREPDQEEKIKRKEFYDIADISMKVEQFIHLHCGAGNNPGQYLRKTRVFIKDEIAFTNFYVEHANRTLILEFLDDINADIFLPVFERDIIIAYMIVERNGRPRQLYSSIEQDEMLVFSSYLSNIISILKHGNLDLFLKEEKELQEEIYHKHQEINLFKESIRSFLRSSQDRKIGIVQYKARRFTIANQVAKELIEIDLNVSDGDPLTQAFKSLARDVLDFRCPQAVTTRDIRNNKIILSGIPSVDQNSVIILVFYPEISDIIKPQIDLLTDPSCWDYLLYLEMTHAGYVVNRFIPGSGATLLNFKIELLAVALSKKILLLETHEDDLFATVEILHCISMRQGMHDLKLVMPEKHNDSGIKLFGINPLCDSREKNIPLLERFSMGTIFIQNVHLLSLETQKKLADYITYGFYQRFKSDHNVPSKARIICSSTQNIQTLAINGTFSKELCNALKANALQMPSLVTLAAHEVCALADGFAEQALKSQTFKSILQLSTKDKEKILDQKPASIQELKDKVYQMLMQKTARHQIPAAQQFDAAYNFNDPELMQAIRLGKKALQDPHIMQLLWEKFGNQTKIALVLGVNKSSVNRRFKEYDFTEN